MANIIFLESPESVIDLLWDIALACFAVRLALIYAALSLAAAAALSVLLPLLLLPFLPAAPLLRSWPSPSTSSTSPFSHPPPPPLPLPLLALLSSSALAARCTVARYEIPRSVPFRLAVGGVAAAVVALAGAVLAPALSGLCLSSVVAVVVGSSGENGGDGEGTGGSGGWRWWWWWLGRAVGEMGWAARLAALGSFALMPALLVGVERWWDGSWKMGRRARRG